MEKQPLGLAAGCTLIDMEPSVACWRRYYAIIEPPRQKLPVCAQIWP